MEAKLGRKVHHFYGPVMPELQSMGKKSLEWDLNDWNWDGDLFTAAPLNSVPADCRSKQLFPLGTDMPVSNDVSNSLSSGSDEVVLGNGSKKRELEKRRRVVDVEHEKGNDEAGSLNLKLGGKVYPITEGEEEKSMKKTKVVIQAPSNRSVCQVEDCRADLSNAKDYHRRHKVCDVHSKANRALVGNVMQRFCQQCSRFHVLEEFDEGKRSCRRRLAGHNKRRRKTHPETVTNGSSLDDERGSNYLLVSLLRILSNIHSNDSDQTEDQDLLSHLLKNLASRGGAVHDRSSNGPLPVSQDMQNADAIIGTAAKVPVSNADNCVPVHATDGAMQHASVSQSDFLLATRESNSEKANAHDTAMGRAKLSNIDLNNAYDDSQECMENLKHPAGPQNVENISPGGPLWYKEPKTSSPPKTYGNSGCMAMPSPFTSSGETQGRTDRIVFKLFGKDPSDFPLALRQQILDWLSHSPTDIESYIRPGCIILTIYLRMDNYAWEELYYNLSSRLRRLLSSSTDSFWRTGWIYTRVQQRVAFVYNGQIVLDTMLPLRTHRSCRISSIRPLAVSIAEDVEFSVKGFNLSQPTTRLLCALEGKYLVQKSCADMMGVADSFVEHNQIQSLSFPLLIPNVYGRGFIEVEDHGLNSSFFPFIVAEKDVCSEICTLESVIEVKEDAKAVPADSNKLEARDQAMDFIHEIGWLLHKSRVKVKLGEGSTNMDLFPFKRFRWLIEFSIDHEWCAVVKQLLDILFDGTVDIGQHSSIVLALLDIAILHRAVKRNSRSMVQTLLRYHPDGSVNNSGSKQKQHDVEVQYVFRPNAIGPGGLTPLHIAASQSSREDILDALTEDPDLVGIEAWKSARDSTGLTPYDYACFRGHYSYINLVQRKISKKSGSGHVVLDIPSVRLDNKVKLMPFHTEKTLERADDRHCRQCKPQLAYASHKTSLAIYRPAMLSMVAIAAVCVCVALLFKSSPQVLYVFQPFRWELLKYGSM